MPRDRKKAEDEGPSAPGWMVTYGDMMSLLLTFFVLLLSFSAINEEDFKEAITSLQGALGILPDNLSIVPIQQMPRPPRPVPRSIERLARELRRRMQVLGKEADVQVEYDAQGGLKIDLPSRILFDTARAELKPGAYPVLTDLGELLADVHDAFIEVRGHTDSRPLTSSTTYRDNYDLSFGRADAVARYLHRVGRIEMNQFEIVACGPGQPVETNATPEGRQANRRVELYVRGKFSDEEMEALQPRIDALTTGAETRQDVAETSAPEGF